MSMENFLDSNKVSQRREELKAALDWKIMPKLQMEEEYRITIAYRSKTSKMENIKILGFYKGMEVAEKVLKFFDKFLIDVDDFGLLSEHREKREVIHFEISFSRSK